MSANDLSNFSLYELFRVEVDNQTKILTTGLLALERSALPPAELEGLMRAAHSIKGAARIIDLPAGVRVAHAMEDCFVAAQNGKLILKQKHIDLLLSGVDMLIKLSQTPEAEVVRWESDKKREIDALVTGLGQLLEPQEEVAQPESPPPVVVKTVAEPIAQPESLIKDLAGGETGAKIASSRHEADRVLRVTADNLNRLLGLAGESLVESRRLHPLAESLLRLKRQQGDLTRMLDAFGDKMSDQGMDEDLRTRLRAVQDKIMGCRQFLADHMEELDLFDRRSTHLSQRLYDEALACRMRPFADGIHGFPRMVRDVARSLGKEVRMEIVGETTKVDRDMLEQLEAPLTHLLRNAVDHGIEFPEARLQAGKSGEGVVRLEARHSAGLLQITVSDDGRGIDLEALRRAIVKKKLMMEEVAAKLGEGELLEFLFLPGFTMKETVTEVSGRGVGLDAVQHMVKQVRGTVRLFTNLGKGSRFQLQLPLTLSVVRTLLVEVGGEPYAWPLAYITRTLKLPRTEIETLEGRQHFSMDGRQIGIVTAHQIMGIPNAGIPGDEVSVIVVEGRDALYGIVVDHFLGERELVVHPLDPRLGKIKDISAGALMEDGSPLLIMDVEDLIDSIDKLVSGELLNKVEESAVQDTVQRKKQVLIVDDSLTVRELERKVLESRGYEVQVAVNGLDGWNAVRNGHFDLVISDVDMPRMDGIEMVTLIKRDPATKSLPVIIISYKDREEDRQRGLEAGADYYLTKGSFHRETLLTAVKDMIGEPEA